MSRARRAGNTLTSSSVHRRAERRPESPRTAPPRAMATTTNDSGAHLARPTPASTGTRNTTTIQPAWASVRANRAMNSRRADTGAASTSRRSSRQEERGQRRHDAAEGEERQEREEQPRQADADQVVAELGVLRRLGGDPERAADQRADDAKRDAAEDAARAAGRRARAGARGCATAQKRRQQQERERPRRRGTPRVSQHDLVDLLQAAAAGELQEDRRQLARRRAPADRPHLVDRAAAR